jgi:coenzyme F420-reducing hydrogenase beta subunit
MESLLSMFGLDRQYIHLDSEFNEAVKSKIDYSKVAPILENNLNISRNYFDDILIKSKNKAKMNILNYRGNISCTSCGVCQTICPLNCIHMAQNTEGFYRPIINEKKCNSCGLCKKVCYRNIPQPREFKNFFEDKLIYGAWSKDEHTHSTSTSGGVGHELLKWGIQNGYEACGVIFDSKNDSCKHTIATTLPEIERYKSSKYVQSYTADAFSKFEKDKKYIVVGTPCQIYGLREFIKLNKTENNFILVDFFCHGTPSMLLWKKYKEYIKTNYKLSDFSKVVFRSKDQSSWHRNSLKISDKNNKTYLKDNAFYEDMFFKFFLSDTCLNESCYNCLLRLDNCASDIRLADFWGQKYAHNEKGVSLVTINTEKGNLFFEEVKPLLETDICSVHDLKNSVPTRFLQKNNKLAMKVMKLLQSENNLSMIYKKTIFPLMKLLYSEHKWSMIYNKMVSLLK